MADESHFPLLPSCREDIEQLRAWNLEISMRGIGRKTRTFANTTSFACGAMKLRNPSATGTPLQNKVWELTYTPPAGAPDRRLCQPEAWFILVEEVTRYLPRNRLRHSYQRLLLIRQNGLNHNFTCGSNKLAMDAQTAVLELFAIAEELEDRLVAALNQLSGNVKSVDSTVRKERARRAIEAANQRADREAKNKEFELKIEPQHAAQALARILNMVGETWTTISPHQLTKLDEKAIYWLVAAGMLERQMTLQLRHIGEPTYFEATINVTGEGGFGEAMQPVHARSYEKWFDAWEKWMESPNAAASPYTTQKLNLGETLRLTDQGMIARDDMRAGNTKVVVEFALKQGFFANRPPSRGTGVCFEFKELHDGTVTSKVRQSEPRIQPRSGGSANSIGEKARQLAQRIANLADDVVRSFAFSSTDDRVRFINGITGEIVHDALPFITWIERNRPLAADLEKRRLLQMEIEAERCATLDIPEYNGGIVSHNADSGTASNGARRTAELFVFCNAFGKALHEWADDIEGLGGASTRQEQPSLATPGVGPCDDRFIFVSYATPDLAGADAIVQLLDSAGLHTWFDKKDLCGGQDWEYEIRRKLEAASLTLICLSTHAVDRKGFFHKEMRYAVDEALKFPKDKIFIMPVRLNDCAIPDDVRRWHTLNLFEPSSSQKLLQSIGTALQCGAMRTN